MELWSIDPRADAAPLPGAVSAALVEGIGEPDFGHRTLVEVARVVPATVWSCYRLRRGGAPTLIASGGLDRPDVGASCWSAYVGDGLYRRDDTLTRWPAAVRPAAPLTLAHWHASELPADHRQAIYQRHGLQERLSLVATEAGGDVVAVNLYRGVGDAGFTADDAARLHPLAPLLLAVVRKQAALGVCDAPRSPAPDLRAVLRRHCPALTARELDVCAGMLQGRTFDGIAVHLGISALTVKTYRNRAFRRLGVQHRSQLFGLLVNEAVLATHDAG